MRLLGSLRIRPFATLWSGQTVSRFGDAVHQIALAWLVLELTGSAAAMGAVLAAHVLPFIVFSLVGGVVVDRLPRLVVMLASDLARMAIVAVIAALVLAERVEFWHLLALSATFGAVEAFFYPAYAAAVPELVPVEQRPSANSLHQLSRRFARLLGPALGAGLVVGGGTGVAFALDSVSYLVSAALVTLAMRVRARATAPAIAGQTDLTMPTQADLAGANDPATPAVLVTPAMLVAPVAPVAPLAGGLGATTRSALADLREGLATVTGEPWIWIAIVAAGVTGITLAGPLEAGLPLLVSEHLGGGIIGACGATVGLVWINTLQDLVPADRLGRVSSIDALGSSALEPVGLVVAGVAADAWGPATVFTVGGLSSAAILSLALLSPSVRRLD